MIFSKIALIFMVMIHITHEACSDSINSTPTKNDQKSVNTHFLTKQTPNILIIYADDLGYGDVSCYNPEQGKIPTPHIDRLATQGLRFTDAHSASSVCTPSRYGLLTGRYPWRTRLQKFVLTTFDKPLINPNRLTIAGLARAQGYTTACIGKWHLGWDWDIPELEKSLPLLLKKYRPADVHLMPLAPTQNELQYWETLFSKRIFGGPTSCGFDRYFGTDAPNYPPYCFIENDHTQGSPSAYLTKDKFQKNQTTMQGPAMPGWNFEDILPALGDQAVSYINEATQAKKPFLLYLPLTSPHTPLAVNANWRGKSHLNTYADFVMETDALVGKILDAVEVCGARENTMVIFSADNGCTPHIGVEELEKLGHFPSANWRGYKASAWEGGHRVPFIVRWPNIVKAGEVCDQLIQQTDLMATLADLFAVRLPDNAGEDSFSLLPLLKGLPKKGRDHSVSTSLNGMPALRVGSWKLILGNPSSDYRSSEGPQPIQLFDLSQDPTESCDLSAKYPERMASMRKLMEKLIVEGRSTPGMIQPNDVEVIRHPLRENSSPKVELK